jgi:hypothetical protein
MSNKKVSPFIPFICISSIILAPLLNQPSKSVLTRESKGVIRDTGTVIKVVDKGKSNSGFEYCKFIIEQPIQGQYVGSCYTSDDKRLKVGWSYNSNKFKLDGENINIYTATEISSNTMLQVVDIKVRAGTRLAILSNGDVVGGNNVSVGDWVAVR